MTTIVNTHDMNSVVDIGENIIFIHEGQKAWEGSNKEIYNTGCTEFDEFFFSSSITKQMKKP